jgi:hypothetical protein
VVTRAVGANAGWSSRIRAIGDTIISDSLEAGPGAPKPPSADGQRRTYLQHYVLMTLPLPSCH